MCLGLNKLELEIIYIIEIKISSVILKYLAELLNIDQAFSVSSLVSHAI